MWFIPLMRCPRATHKGNYSNKSHNPSLQADNPYLINLYEESSQTDLWLPKVFESFCFFEERKGRESRQKKNLSKGENQEQAPPILMFMFEPNLHNSQCPQI